MNNMMEFPETPLEFVESYKFKDSDEIYTNGSELIPVFRVEQMLEHYYEPLKEKAIPKKPKEWCVPDDFGFALYKRCMCSNCHEEIVKVWIREKGNVPNYCPACGQKLDWSEEE